MPIKVQSDLPAKEILEYENIFVMDENRAIHQDIRPLQVCILNLMPVKQDTELQLLRALSNTPLQVDVTFLMVASHISLNTSANHLNRFYTTFDEIKHKRFDGLIITGAPVEDITFEEVDYWDEVCGIMDWAEEHVTSTLHICWGAQAGLYHYYGIQKRKLPEKLFGIYSHKVQNRKVPLVRGFDDYFLAPHSRHTETPAADNVIRLLFLRNLRKQASFLPMHRMVKKYLSMAIRSMTVIHLMQSIKEIWGKGFPYIFRGIITPIMTRHKSPVYSGAHIAIIYIQTG